MQHLSQYKEIQLFEEFQKKKTTFHCKKNGAFINLIHVMQLSIPPLGLRLGLYNFHELLELRTDTAKYQLTLNAKRKNIQELRR